MIKADPHHIDQDKHKKRGGGGEQRIWSILRIIDSLYYFLPQNMPTKAPMPLIQLLRSQNTVIDYFWENPP